MFFEKTRYSITLKAAFLIFAITLTATIVRPLLIEQSVIFTYVGIVNSIALGAVFFYIKYSSPKSWFPLLLFIVGFAVLTPITLISGGVNSQFAYLIPIVPMFMALVSSPRYTWIVTGIIFVVILLLFLGGDLLPDLTYEDVPQSKSASRALWLFFSVVLSAKFGIEFNRTNSKLGDKLSQQAEIDVLTGIPNRRSVMNFLQKTIDESAHQNSAVCVMIIDLDYFKSVNDKFGHLAGDQCLKMVAHSIEQCVRHNHDLAGRFGGEEFIVVIRGIHAKKAAEIAENIRRSIEQTPITLDDAQEVRLTSTVGVFNHEAGQMPAIEKVIESADKALYQGKKSGRNCVVMASSHQP